MLKPLFKQFNLSLQSSAGVESLGKKSKSLSECLCKKVLKMFTFQLPLRISSVMFIESRQQSCIISL